MENLESVICKLAMKDEEIKNALRQKILTGLKEVGFGDMLKEQLTRAFEYAFEDFDLGPTIKQPIKKVLKDFLEEKLGVTKPNKEGD